MKPALVAGHPKKAPKKAQEKAPEKWITHIQYNKDFHYRQPYH